MITVDDKFITPNGKEIGIRISGGTALYEPFFTSGGEYPEALRGRYTSPKKASEAIEKYIATNKFRKPKKEVQDNG